MNTCDRCLFKQLKIALSEVVETSHCAVVFNTHQEFTTIGVCKSNQGLCDICRDIFGRARLLFSGRPLKCALELSKVAFTQFDGRLCAVNHTNWIHSSSFFFNILACIITIYGFPITLRWPHSIILFSSDSSAA